MLSPCKDLSLPFLSVNSFPLQSGAAGTFAEICLPEALSQDLNVFVHLTGMKF